jgi:hypothetical protein
MFAKLPFCTILLAVGLSGEAAWAQDSAITRTILQKTAFRARNT